MTSFKVGDKVRRTESSFEGMRVGDIGTVTEVRDQESATHGPYQDVYLVEFPRGHASYNLELIDEYYNIF